MKRQWIKGRKVRKENGVVFRVKGHYRLLTRGKPR